MFWPSAPASWTTLASAPGQNKNSTRSNRRFRPSTQLMSFLPQTEFTERMLHQHFWRTAPHSLLTNLTLLSHIDRVCSSVITVSDLTPVALRRFIEHPSMMEFRAHLRRETSEDGVATAALAHKMLYSEALHRAQVP